MRNPSRRFALRLAYGLGFYNVDAMLDTAPIGQFYEWQAYHLEEPFGEDWKRSSLSTVRIINTLAAIASGMGGKALTEDEMLPDDAFIPKYRPDHLDEALAAKLAAIDSLEGFGF